MDNGESGKYILIKDGNVICFQVPTRRTKIEPARTKQKMDQFTFYH